LIILTQYKASTITRKRGYFFLVKIKEKNNIIKIKFYDITSGKKLFYSSVQKTPSQIVQIVSKIKERLTKHPNWRDFIISFETPHTVPQGRI